MITAFIVLAIVACGLGGYIVYDVLRDKKKLTSADASEAAQITVEKAVEGDGGLTVKDVNEKDA